MPNTEKPDSLGLEFLNDQQRFRRGGFSNQPPAQKPAVFTQSHAPVQPAPATRQVVPVVPLQAAHQVKQQPLQHHHNQQSAQHYAQQRPTPQHLASSNNPHVESLAVTQHNPSATNMTATDHASSTAKRRLFRRKKIFIPLVLALIAAVAGGAFVTLSQTADDTPKNNVTTAKPFTKQTPASNIIAANISDAPVTADDIKKYTAAADMPRYMTVDKLTITARVTQIGITYAGSIQTPDNVHDVGWYTGSAKPGTTGVMLMVGHLSGTKLPGIFSSLNTITVGDIIKVQRGDNQTFSYKVIKKESVKASDVTMEQLLAPVTAGKAGLNLMTSTDGQKNTTGDPVDNLIVYCALI